MTWSGWGVIDVRLVATLAITFVAVSVLLWAMVAGHLPVAFDRPNERSLHATAIPRTGGVAVLLGLAPSIILLGVGALPILSMVAFALGMISLFDDFLNLPAALRFVAHILAAATIVILYPVPAPFPVLFGSVLAIGWMINLFNFMDGANGLAGGMAFFGFSAYALAAFGSGAEDLGILAASVVVAALAFLRFNFHPARIFLGDVGSIPLGFLAGALGYVGWGRGSWPLWFPVFVFSPFIVDATVTLMRRMLRGDRVWQAHREHSYQKLVRLGWSHRRLALAEYALMMVMSSVALLLLRADGLLVWLAIGGATVCYSGLVVFVDVKWRAYQSTVQS